MGKHVCPVCETVYAERGAVEVVTEAGLVDHEYWECPSCNYQFVSLTDMQEVITRLDPAHAVSIKLQRPSKTVG